MIAGYAEAVLEERRRRNRAECDIPETVCGVALRPLTLRDVTILQEAGVAFFDESPDALDASVSTVMLLWWQWTKRPEPASYRDKRRFSRRIGKLPMDQVWKEISEWIQWQFADAPPSNSTRKGTPPPITSFAVSITDAVASRCSWPRHEILNTPLPILWQHLKLSAASADPKSPRFNPSDRVKTEFMKKLAEEASARA